MTGIRAGIPPVDNWITARRCRWITGYFVRPLPPLDNRMPAHARLWIIGYPVRFRDSLPRPGPPDGRSCPWGAVLGEPAAIRVLGGRDGGFRGVCGHSGAICRSAQVSPWDFQADDALPA